MVNGSNKKHAKSLRLGMFTTWNLRLERKFDKDFGLFTCPKYQCYSNPRKPFSDEF